MEFTSNDHTSTPRAPRREAPVDYIFVPGIGGSDSSHWQTYWEAELGDRAVRLAPRSWSEPEWDDWLACLSETADRVGDVPVVLVAHSLGCLTAAAWLGMNPGRRAAGFLVAPPDTAGIMFPTAAVTFKTADHGAPISVPTTVVSSRDDPYSDPSASAALAARWGAEHIDGGAVGHINSASNLGEWQDGRRMLRKLVARML
jgi:predicted alpha/beta hydrolase family esterase